MIGSNKKAVFSIFSHIYSEYFSVDVLKRYSRGTHSHSLPETDQRNSKRVTLPRKLFPQQLFTIVSQTPVHTKAIRPFIWNNQGKSLHATKRKVCKSTKGRWRCCLMCICFLSYGKNTVYQNCLHTQESGDNEQMFVNFEENIFHAFCRWHPGCCGRCGSHLRKHWESFVLYTGPHTGKYAFLATFALERHQ